MLIRAENLSKSIGSKVLFENLNFNIEDSKKSILSDLMT